MAKSKFHSSNRIKIFAQMRAPKQTNSPNYFLRKYTFTPKHPFTILKKLQAFLQEKIYISAEITFPVIKNGLNEKGKKIFPVNYGN